MNIAGAAVVLVDVRERDKSEGVTRFSAEEVSVIPSEEVEALRGDC